MIQQQNLAREGHSVLPPGRHFAFTIIDDTDDATVENVAPVYDALHDLGFGTTKTIWAIDAPAGTRSIYHAGQTLQRPEYLCFVKSLVERGFELAWHCAGPESSTRERTLDALIWFEREFGFVPRLHCNHGHNAENIYWGPMRYQHRFLRWLASVGARRRNPKFAGECPESPYFWGDLCLRHFDYVRNLTFVDLNLLRRDPLTPYRLAETPWVNYWFSTTDAPDIHAFNRRITRDAFDRLATERGIGIVSTHFGKGFAPGGKLDPTFRATMEYAASLGGWYVPASALLDRLRDVAPAEQVRRSTLFLELRHVVERIVMRLIE